jgi:hypothetical protein
LTHASIPLYRYVAWKTEKSPAGGAAEPGAANKKADATGIAGRTRHELLSWVGEDV